MGSSNLASRRGAQKRALKGVAMLKGVAVMVAMLAFPMAHAADMIGVNLDQAKLVKLPEGTSTVVVGNPSIADVSVQRNGVVVITGRRAGRTNFIALDKSGAIISESSVAVSVATAGRVVLRRGVEATTYDCSTECLPSAAYGDDDKSFARAISQGTMLTKEARESMSATSR